MVSFNRLKTFSAIEAINESLILYQTIQSETTKVGRVGVYTHPIMENFYFSPATRTNSVNSLYFFGVIFFEKLRLPSPSLLNIWSFAGTLDTAYKEVIVLTNLVMESLIIVKSFSTEI